MTDMEHYTQRHLRMRKDQPILIRFLLWIGFVKFGRKNFTMTIDQYLAGFNHPEVIIWPFSIPPWHVFKYCIKVGPRFYVFRNLPGVIKWLPGRLLPNRWGFGICCFEFGDRG